jgi:Tfp pilus assembly protein PilO
VSGLWAQFIVLCRFRPVITACYAIAVILGVLNYFLWQQRAAETTRHEEVRKKGEFMRDALANRARIERDLAALAEAMFHVERNVVDELSMEVNLGYFYKLERSTRVRLVRLNQLGSLPAAPDTAFKAVPFSMQVVGSYRNIMNFLRELETGPRLLRIRSCTFEQGVRDSTELIMNLTVDALART